MRISIFEFWLARTGIKTLDAVTKSCVGRRVLSCTLPSTRMAWVALSAFVPSFLWAQAPPTSASPNSPVDAKADKPQEKQPNFLLGGQATFIGQGLLPFHSPYSGSKSLISPSTLAADWTDTYTLFLGWRATKGLEFYVDPEMARGAGVGGAAGLGAFTNGDVLRVPGSGIGALPQSPYLARYIARVTLSVGKGSTAMAAGENQIPGEVPAHRLVLSAGKMATTDIFDTNSYANSTRTQFMNWALINNAAYDYAADTRGYSDGVAAEWIHPTWALRAGVFEMPIVANGPVLATHWNQDQGAQIEGEVHPQLLRGKDHAIVRLLAYRNLAHMGNYRQALSVAQQTGMPPNIVATETNGAVKYGFGLNLEQPLGDDGDTGLFARLGWDDGATESFAYTECDDALSVGAQISGKRWGVKGDRLGVAILSDGLSPAHREYLAEGGVGFILGDGKLNYGEERVLETYYNHSLWKYATIGADIQLISNPGYNQDRGPVAVPSVRVHFEF